MAKREKRSAQSAAMSGPEVSPIQDLREWLVRVDEIGELIRVKQSGDWDEEDEQKYGDCPAAAYYQKNTRPGITKAPIGDDDVVTARESDLCCGEKEELRIQVLDSAERRRRDVEKEERRGFLFS